MLIAEGHPPHGTPSQPPLLLRQGPHGFDDIHSDDVRIPKHADGAVIGSPLKGRQTLQPRLLARAFDTGPCL